LLFWCIVLMYCFSRWGSVSFCLHLLSDLSKTRPNISISFCRHLEHCQVWVKFAFQYCRVSYIYRNVMVYWTLEHHGTLVNCYGVMTS
jgi:hypothetical protein